MHHINQFKSVLALTHYRHFGRAASSIGLTQSALSQNIRKLEEFYGVTLFERRNHQVSLTAYGKVVHNTAKLTLDAIQNTQREIQLLQNLSTGHLKVSADPYVASSLLAPALSRLLKAHPRLRFTSTNISWEQAQEQLLNDEIDIYFGILPDAISSELTLDLLDIPTPLILCHPEHELTQHPSVSLADAISYPIATPTAPPWFLRWARQEVDKINEQFDFNSLIFLQADSIDMVKRVTQNTEVTTAALPSDVESDIELGKLTVLHLENWPTTMQGCIITKSSRAIPPAGALLTRQFKESVTLEFVKKEGY